MSANVYPEMTVSRRSPIVWLAPIQAVAAFTVLAVIGGGQILRGWILGALLFLMAAPLMISLEAGLMAMILFEPFRGFIRRAQYLIVDYSQFDPIHVLTPLVTLMALGMLLQRHRFQIIRSTPLASVVTTLSAIFVAQIFNPLQGGLMIGLSGAMLTLVPVSWFYFGQATNLRFIRLALQLIVALGILTSLYGVYQLIYGYPQFERYWLENVEFYVSIGVGHVKRPLATFTNAEEWGRYIAMGALIAFGFGAGTKRLLNSGAWFLCAGGLATVLLLTGQRTAIFGLMLGFLCLILLGARSFRGAAVRLVLLLIPVLLVVTLAKPPSEDEMWSKEESETVGTLISHTQRGTLKPTGEDSLYVRLEVWQDLVTNVIPYRPLGSGLGAGSLGALKFSDNADETAIDNFVLVLAVAGGIPAALLFLWILWRATLFAFRQTRRGSPGTPEATIARIIAALMPMFILNNIFGLTFSLYAVAPVGWLLIGWISAGEGRARTEEAGAGADGRTK
ncbi:MAG: O-antigen ligase family protein [Acidobacteriota bacterium]|nr:O-antigen ligase family protein [Acidobacteriota bacterium]